MEPPGGHIPNGAQAILGAASGDTLEIRGSNAIRIAPLHLHDKALVIRAASGARPTLGVSRIGEPLETPWIQSEASLVIEGLDIQCGPAEANAFLPPSILLVRRAPLRLANCRFIHRGAGPAIRLEDPTLCEVRNCLLLCSQSTALDCIAAGRLRMAVENCIVSGLSGFTVHQMGQATDATLENSATIRSFFMRQSAYTWIWRSVSKVREVGGPSSMLPLLGTCSIPTAPC